MDSGSSARRSSARPRRENCQAMIGDQRLSQASSRSLPAARASASKTAQNAAPANAASVLGRSASASPPPSLSSSRSSACRRCHSEEVDVALRPVLLDHLQHPGGRRRRFAGGRRRRPSAAPSSDTPVDTATSSGALIALLPTGALGRFLATSERLELGVEVPTETRGGSAPGSTCSGTEPVLELWQGGSDARAPAMRDKQKPWIRAGWRPQRPNLRFLLRGDSLRRGRLTRRNAIGVG